MRFSKLYAPTLREEPADAEVASHRLMLRAGMIRKLAAGIYSYLPLGYRAIRKVEQIVREEMDRVGAQEVRLPSVQPSELWIESGRWTQYGPELLRFQDRHQREFCLGPTHEEVITDLVRGEIRSYRDMPQNLYQIQTKFRDEIRPRFGLMRGREFIMKDAYSFDVDDAASEESYRAMYEAYRRIFTRCGLEFRAVEADTGNIGGSHSHEFMVLAASGEDAIAASEGGHYAANVEKAAIPPPPGPTPEPTQLIDRVHTPDAKTIDEVAAFLDAPKDRIVKTLLVDTEKGVVICLVRGDHELNAIKLARLLGVPECLPTAPDVVEKITQAPVGFAGPVGLNLPIYADNAVRPMVDFIVGANDKDYHLTGVNHGRDFEVKQWADLRNARDGDPSPRGDGKLRIHRGIEVGHIFKLGTKYSEAMNARYLDEQGNEKTIVMGCYGIGIGRTVAAAIEQNHDEDGIRWPIAIAPYEVLIVSLYAKKGREEVEAASEKLYEELTDAGVEVLWDDRDERPGAKFKDADLIGVPIRVTVGAKSLAESKVEYKLRTDESFTLVPVEEIAAKVGRVVREAKGA